MNDEAEAYYRQQESEQKQLHEAMEHQSRETMNVERLEYNLFSMLKPQLFIDGNQWCVLHGNNIQAGVCGFGSSPHKAILAFNKAWDRDIIELTKGQVRSSDGN